jgi:hypothetical protein
MGGLTGALLFYCLSLTPSLHHRAARLDRAAHRRAGRAAGQLNEGAPVPWKGVTTG